MTAHPRDARGFTLIELLVVLTIFGILIAMAAPPVSGFLRSSRLAGATNTLVSDLYYTRSLANAQRKTYRILFSGSSYVVSRVSPAKTIRTRTMPRGITIAASDTATFYAWGLTDPVNMTVTSTLDSTSRVLRLGANGSVRND